MYAIFSKFTLVWSVFIYWTTGLQHSVILGSEPYGLPLDVTIMPQWLQKLGYRTHMVGKVVQVLSS